MSVTVSEHFDRVQLTIPAAHTPNRSMELTFRVSTQNWREIIAEQKGWFSEFRYFCCSSHVEHFDVRAFLGEIAQVIDGYRSTASLDEMDGTVSLQFLVDTADPQTVLLNAMWQIDFDAVEQSGCTVQIRETRLTSTDLRALYRGLTQMADCYFEPLPPND